MTSQEFKAMVGKLNINPIRNEQFTPSLNDPDPNIDWTTKGKVTKVKDQG